MCDSMCNSLISCELSQGSDLWTSGWYLLAAVNLKGGSFVMGRWNWVVVLSALCVQGVKQMDFPIPAGYVMCPIHRNHISMNHWCHCRHVSDLKQRRLEMVRFGAGAKVQCSSLSVWPAHALHRGLALQILSEGGPWNGCMCLKKNVWYPQSGSLTGK